jgi:pimeloyl-ACP methyl ester carboxylesterase
MTKFRALLTATASLAALSGYPAVAAPAKTIVLVHGAFADGSGWKPVADILIKDGYKVAIVQQPMTSLEDDVAATSRILDRQEAPVVLVAHSYGGAIITEAGNDPKVTALVYVAAFAPDAGEVLGGLLQKTPSASTGIAPSKDGFLFLDPAVYAADFAGDLPKAEGEFLALSQMPVLQSFRHSDHPATSVEGEAHICNRFHPGSDDQSGLGALDVPACQGACDRNQGQPRRVPVPAPRSGASHRGSSATRRLGNAGRLAGLALVKPPPKHARDKQRAGLPAGAGRHGTGASNEARLHALRIDAPTSARPGGHRRCRAGDRARLGGNLPICPFWAVPAKGR